MDRESKLRGINGLTRTKDDKFKVLQVGSSDLMAKDLQSCKEKISALADISGAAQCSKEDQWAILGQTVQHATDRLLKRSKGREIQRVGNHGDRPVLHQGTTPGAVG